MRSQVGHFSPYKETNRTKRIDFHPNSVFPMCFGNTVWVNFLAFAWSLLELLHVVPVPINHYTTQVDPLATTTRQAKIRLKGLSFPFNQWFLLVLLIFTAFYCSVTAQELCGHWSHMIYTAKTSSCYLFVSIADCAFHGTWQIGYFYPLFPLLSQINNCSKWRPLCT